MKPLFKFQNKVIELLLSGARTKGKNLIDLSMSRSPDLYKWMQLNYLKVVGLDTDKSNIDFIEKSLFAKMRSDDNEVVRAWANSVDIDFKVADSSKDLSNFFAP